MPDALDLYRRKRRFARTPEPAGAGSVEPGHLFVVHKHAARRLHYDLRLQFADVLKSWAVTRGPSLDPAERRLAVHVEDHPLDYGAFEGTIPKGEYGAGGVIIWDRGNWTPLGNAEEDYARGALKFRLAGHKLRGGWTLVRLKRRERERDNWLLIKERDEYARPGDGDLLLREAPESVVSTKSLESLTEAAKAPPAAQRRPRPIDPNALPGARPAPLPDFVAPQLATMATAPPEGEQWLHEIKLDGYRTLVRIDGATVRLRTRNGHDWTSRYGDLPSAFQALAGNKALLDGEVVVQDAAGISSFAELQDALSRGRPDTLLFYAFDLLHLDGLDLTPVPLIERKEALSRLLDGVAGEASPVQFSDHIAGAAGPFVERVCRMGLEGIVSKRRDAPYSPGRSKTWLKTKCAAGDEFVIVGFTESKAAGGLGALLVASAEDGALTYAGRVGTGFSRTEAERVRATLGGLRREAPPLAMPAMASRETVRWVEPRLIVDVNYANRTREGLLRQASYKGLRGDKSLADLGRAGSSVGGGGNDSDDEERDPTASPPAEPVRKPRLISDADLASIWVTNPEREMFGGSGATKLDLVSYYARVGDWMLPELLRRPVSLVRCPTGEAEACFYQRHAGAGMPDAVKRIGLREGTRRERADYVYLDDARGLLGLAQFGVVEFHPWGCQIDRPERPDRLIFDLDPDEGLRWREVVTAALDIRAVLEGLGLAVFVKTTGGKGLHLVVPLARRQTWEAVRGFSERLVKALARREPSRFTAILSKASRKGRIFIDYLRNGRGATAVAAYSLRARAGLPVATPLHWAEVEALDDPAIFNFRSVPERLAGLAADPWASMDTAGVSFDKAMIRAVDEIGASR